MTGENVAVRAVPLNRAAFAARTGESAAPAPVRIVHIGLGAFARAHQAWYTAQVDERGEWGIAAFTGRSPDVAEELAPQDGLFTLLRRSAEGDTAEIVTSIVAVEDGANVARLVELIAAPGTAVVTLTITESGYRLRADGAPDLGDAVVAEDLSLVRALLAGAEASSAPRSALGRLVVGLAARRTAGAGPLAIVPCDNMPDNGSFVRQGLRGFAESDPALVAWIDDNVSFVSTSVDRITPKTVPEDIVDVAALTGWQDASPVVTEPFSDWILSGDFPAGRPRWEQAGARVVEDIEPFERRKLWLLNGAHSLLAYSGMLRGHRTVAEAIGDPVCAAEVEDVWDAAARHLPEDLGLDEYRDALRARFANARIAHHLAQIAGEAVAKLRVRIVPVALAERGQDRPAGAAATAIGAWVALVLRRTPLTDAQEDAVSAAAALPEPEVALVALLDDALAADSEFMEQIRSAVRSRR